MEEVRFLVNKGRDPVELDPSCPRSDDAAESLSSLNMSLSLFGIQACKIIQKCEPVFNTASASVQSSRPSFRAFKPLTRSILSP
jgi:hypothetical protein